MIQIYFVKSTVVSALLVQPYKMKQIIKTLKFLISEESSFLLVTLHNNNYFDLVKVIFSRNCEMSQIIFDL